MTILGITKPDEKTLEESADREEEKAKTKARGPLTSEIWQKSWSQQRHLKKKNQ